jgi:predicted nucleic acid-binding protein
MKIYLDNCCFNRPYDNQRNIKIKLEAEAKLYIQQLIRSSKLQLVWSNVLDYENLQNPFEERKLRISSWKKFAINDIEENTEIIKKAIRLNEIGLRKMDALHVSCAIQGQCSYFITTDKGILKKSHVIEEVKITDPIFFIKEIIDD